MGESSTALQDFSFAFLGLLLEGGPFIIMGTIFSGFIDAYLSPKWLERILPRRKTPAILIAGLLGMILPVCECAIVPVIRRLVGKGLPIGSAFAYMLAAPIVNPITLFSTYKAFNDQWLMPLSRLGMGYLIAISAGFIATALPLHKILKPSVLRSTESRFHDHGKGHRLTHAMRTAQADFVDVAVYFTLGIAITALFNTGVAPGLDALDKLADSPVGGPVALMMVAFLLSLCSTSDAFVVAALDKFNYASKMAFMVLGPMIDLKLLFLYQTLLRRRFLMLMVLSLFVVVLALCLAWDVLFQLQIKGR